MATDAKKRSFSDVSEQPEIDSRPTKIAKTISNGQIVQPRPSVAPAVVTNTMENPGWKTVPCKNFTSTGYCTYGVICQFMHGLADYKGGAGNENAVNQQGVNAAYKTVPCQRFALMGSCDFGSTCQFMHGNTDFAGGTGNGVPKPYKTVPCRHFSMTGYCSFGAMCQFFHGREQARNPAYKTRICENWKNTGTCSYEGVCQFLHGQGDPVLGANVMLGQNSTAFQGSAQFPLAMPPWQPPPNMNPYAVWHENPAQYPLGTLPQNTAGSLGYNQVQRKPSNYKTVLCRHYARDGTCLRGDTCLFMHSNDGTVCAHPNYKTVPCRNWSSTGSCPYAHTCQFKHPGED